MNKKISWRELGWLAIVVILGLSLACGNPYQAPYGAKVQMPAGTSIESSQDIVIHISALVIDKNNLPLNDVEVRFYLCCDGGYLLNMNANQIDSEDKIRTNEIGAAEVDLYVYGDFEGDLTVSADIGTNSAETKISKTLPSV